MSKLQKKKITLQEHKDITDALEAQRENITELSKILLASYRKTSQEYKIAVKVRGLIDALWFLMDERRVAENPGEVSKLVLSRPQPEPQQPCTE